ncbi:HTH_Tnp_Tc3_2 domain-containing protein [Trichonephila clavipes]|nr:HTH_Tnp_Tc3_2 domain-containing protein [Trichonephila clavipes]
MPVVSNQSLVEDGEEICWVFSDESRLCLGSSDRHVLVRRRPEEYLQPNCLRPRHTGPTPGVRVWGAISYMMAGSLSWLSQTH